MKRFALILLILIILINACQKVSETKSEKIAKQLSDMQVTACNTANDAGTCDTRLPELGVVLKEDCCQILGKCC